MHLLPSEQELYRLIRLKKSTVWNHSLLTVDTIEKWLSNFTSKVFDQAYERQLALWLLVNFVYYNESEVRHLIRVVFREYLHRALITMPSITTVHTAIQSVVSETRFFHLGNPGESGGFLLYLFRQENNLPKSWFPFSPGELSDRVDKVIFVDDATISGHQALDYLKAVQNTHGLDQRIILLSLISTIDAQALLRKQGIEVISGIVLDERSKCFSPSSIAFHHFPEHRDNCKHFALTYGRQINGSEPLGFDDGEYTFGFYYNTPDNSLPIFWQDVNWIPVVKRYKKLYLEVLYNDLGRFV